MGNFNDGYDLIFGKDKPVQHGSWVQDIKTGRFIPKSEITYSSPDAPAVLTAPEPFISPIDGTLIDDRAQLRRHNKRHGVTDFRDYGKGYFERKQQERETVLRSSSSSAKEERVHEIKRAMQMHGAMNDVE